MKTGQTLFFINNLILSHCSL